MGRGPNRPQWGALPRPTSRPTGAALPFQAEGEPQASPVCSLGVGSGHPTQPHSCRSPLLSPHLQPQVPGLVKEYEKGTTKLDDYITHRLPFKDINGGSIQRAVFMDV